MGAKEECVEGSMLPDWNGRGKARNLEDTKFKVHRDSKGVDLRTGVNWI